MTKCSHWLLAGALASFAALSACGAKGNSGNSEANGNGGGPPVPVACLGQAFGGACDSCIQASCGSALGSFGSECSDYVGCYCPNGAYSASAQMSQNCLSKVTANPSCLSSVQTMNGCVMQNCASECQAANGSGSSSGGGTGGGNAGSGSAGGSGGGGMTDACGVAFTSSACAGCVTSQCCSATEKCAGDQGCLGIITCIHGCGSNMTCEHSCITSAPSSAQSELNDAVQCWSSSCGKSGC
jgi:hypothetical protein